MPDRAMSAVTILAIGQENRIWEWDWVRHPISTHADIATHRIWMHIWQVISRRMRGNSCRKRIAWRSFSIWACA